MAYSDPELDQLKSLIQLTSFVDYAQYHAAKL